MRNLSLLCFLCCLFAVTFAARQVNINREYLGKRLAEVEFGDDENEYDDADVEEEEGTESSDQRYFIPAGRTKAKLVGVLNKLRLLLNLEKDEKLVEEHSFRTKDKVLKTKYSEMYKGVPVFDTVVTAAASDLTDVTGHLWQDIDADVKSVTPKVIKTRAFKTAKQAEGDIGRGVQISQPEIELVIYTDKKGKAYLAYVLNYFSVRSSAASTVYKRPFYVIDANTGKVLKSWQGLASEFELKFTGGNEKTGMKPLSVQVTSDKTNTKCTLKNAQVDQIINMQKKTELDSTASKEAYEFNCKDGVQENTNGAYAPLGDAMYYATKAVDMYMSLFGIKPTELTNLRGGIRVRVHLKTDKNTVAFWNEKGVNFGDGTSSFHPPISMDSVIHEISHGFTEKHSNLLYVDQSGGINEAFSDIAGETAEVFFLKACDWKVGTEIVKKRSQIKPWQYHGRGSLRYFADPKKDKKSINTADLFKEGMNVHHSSGPYRLAFYNLVMVQKWKHVDAFKVFAQANMNYWRKRTDYSEGLCGLRAAANDVFGANKAKQVDLTTAFKAVKIEGCEDYGRETLLQLGVASTVGNLRKDSELFFEFMIPGQCEWLKVELTGGKGKIVVYEKRGERPGDKTGEYEHESAEGEGRVMLRVDQGLMYKKEPASHFFMIKAITDASKYSIKATYQKYNLH